MEIQLLVFEMFLFGPTMPLAWLKTPKWRGSLIKLHLGEDVIRYVVQHVVALRVGSALGASTLGEYQWIKQ